MVPRHRILPGADYSTSQPRIRNFELFKSQIIWRISEPQTLNRCDLCRWLAEGLPLYQEKPQKYVSIARAAIERFEDRIFLYERRN